MKSAPNRSSLRRIKQAVITIRPATINDIGEMKALFVDTINHTCRKDYSQEQIDTWTSSVENEGLWKNLINKQYCIVAEINQKIMGFGSLKKGNYVDFLYVHKDYQRKGTADKIFQELVNESRRLGQVKMTSDVSKTARPFFESKGFKVARENKRIVKGVEIINFHMVRQYGNIL